MNAPLVSVIVPTRDAAHLICDFLTSCQQSQYQHVEVIVNDDPRGCDELAAVVRSYAAAGLSIRHVRDNLSMAQARLSAVAYSRGDILMHLDADMRLTPGLVGECVDLIGRGAHALVIPEDSFGTTFWARCKWLEKRCYEGVERIESLRVLTRECYVAVGGHDPSMVFSEDKDLDIRVRRAGFRVGRTQHRLRHNEGVLTLRTTLAKKHRYSATADVFARAHPEQFRWQVNVFHRYVLYLRRVRWLFVHPLLYVGMVVMKTAECGAGAFGFMAAYLARRHGISTQTTGAGYEQ